MALRLTKLASRGNLRSLIGHILDLRQLGKREKQRSNKKVSQAFIIVDYELLTRKTEDSKASSKAATEVQYQTILR